jgi:hypothetical protein
VQKACFKIEFSVIVEQELDVTSHRTGTMAELARMCPSETVIPSKQ